MKISAAIMGQGWIHMKNFIPIERLENESKESFSDRLCVYTTNFVLNACSLPTTTKFIAFISEGDNE